MPFAMLDTANTVLFLLLGVFVLVFSVVITALAIYVGGKKGYYNALFAINWIGLVVYNILVISLTTELAAWISMIVSIIFIVIFMAAVNDAEKAKRIRK